MLSGNCSDYKSIAIQIDGSFSASVNLAQKTFQNLRKYFPNVASNGGRTTLGKSCVNSLKHIYFALPLNPAMSRSHNCVVKGSTASSSTPVMARIENNSELPPNYIFDVSNFDENTLTSHFSQMQENFPLTGFVNSSNFVANTFVPSWKYTTFAASVHDYATVLDLIKAVRAKLLEGKRVIIEGLQFDCDEHSVADIAFGLLATVCLRKLFIYKLCIFSLSVPLRKSLSNRISATCRNRKRTKDTIKGQGLI